MSRTGKIPEGLSRGELRVLLPEFSSPGSIAYDKKRIWVADIEIGEILEWAGLFFPLNRSQGRERVVVCQAPRPVQLCAVSRQQAQRGRASPTHRGFRFSGRRGVHGWADDAGDANRTRPGGGGSLLSSASISGPGAGRHVSGSQASSAVRSDTPT